MSSDITITSLVHRYRDVCALDGVDLSLSPGVTAVVGINGAGKSTLFSILATSLAPTAGHVDYFGTVWPTASGAQLRNLRGLIGLAPQEPELLPRMRVMDFMNYMGWLRGVTAAERMPVAREALHTVDLASSQQRRIGELSGGMRQRLNIAQAIMASPRLLLLDEPTDSLDPEQRVRVREIITNLKATGASVLVASHVIADVVTIADRVVMLEAGRVVFDDSAERLREVGEGIVAPDAGVSVYEAAFLKLRAPSEGGLTA